mgnify:FL=1
MIWGLGNFGGVSLQQMPAFALVTIVGLFGSLLLIKSLNALLLGERYAENLGVNIRRVRNWLLIITGLLTLSPPLSVVRSPLLAWPCRMWPA